MFSSLLSVLADRILTRVKFRLALAVQQRFHGFWGLTVELSCSWEQASPESLLATSSSVGVRLVFCILLLILLAVFFLRKGAWVLPPHCANQGKCWATGLPEETCLIKPWVYFPPIWGKKNLWVAFKQKYLVFRVHSAFSQELLIQIFQLWHPSPIIHFSQKPRFHGTEVTLSTLERV